VGQGTFRQAPVPLVRRVEGPADQGDALHGTGVPFPIADFRFSIGAGIWTRSRLNRKSKIKNRKSI
jgi:hypothetical protein